MQVAYLCKNCSKESLDPVFLTGIEGTFCSDECAQEFQKLILI